MKEKGKEIEKKTRLQSLGFNRINVKRKYKQKKQ